MKKLLPEVCTIQYGFPFDSAKFSDSDGMPLIRIRDVVRGYSETYTTEEYKSEYIVHENDLLIGMDGEFNIAKWGKTPALLNQRVCRLAPKGSIDKDYLFYFMPIALKRIEEKTPFVTVKHLSAKELNKIEIPVLPLEEQRKIAETLSKVDELIAFRDQQLAKLDELVKARFVEMFGNPIENTMNWPKKLLRDITTKIGSGATPKGGRESYPNAGVSLIRSMNVYDGQFLYKDLAHLTDEQATQLNGVTVEAEDVLVNITGASVARSCVVPKDVLPARVNQHVAIVRCNRKLLNPIFTNKMFINNEFKKALLSIGESGGATRQAITKKQLEELSVVVPPLSIQNEFFTFSERVDQQKQTAQQSLEKLELMKKALMQEYFG